MHKKLKISGWPCGWRQYRTRTKIVLLAPSRKGSKNQTRFEYAVWAYPEWLNGITLESWIDKLKAELHAEVMRYAELINLVTK